MGKEPLKQENSNNRKFSVTAMRLKIQFYFGHWHYSFYGVYFITVLKLQGKQHGQCQDRGQQ